MGNLRVGALDRFSGNVTTMQWIVPGNRGMTERNLGYHMGRLDRGFSILVLKQMPEPEDFEFAGTTLRSGGREGLPAESKAADELRARVHDNILRDLRRDGQVGEDDALKAYREKQRKVLASISLSGPQRVAKVIPAIRHNDELRPSQQYPMGAGGLQWVVLGRDSRPARRGLLFLVAAFVHPSGEVDTEGGSLNLRTGGLEARTRLHRYLSRA